MHPNPLPRSLAARAVAWSGAGMAVLSIAGFAALLAGGLDHGARAGTGRATPLGAVAIDVALFSSFALHHSLFARGPVRRLVSRWLSVELERPAYVWLSSLWFLLVVVAWQPLPGTVWQLSGAGAWLLRAGQVTGGVILLRAAARLDMWELVGVRTAGETAPARGFTTRWPYGWVRHPLYLAWVLVVACAPVMTASRLLFAGISTLYVLVAIPLEERTLRAQRADYDAYRRKVRWRILPGLY